MEEKDKQVAEEEVASIDINNLPLESPEGSEEDKKEEPEEKEEIRNEVSYSRFQTANERRREAELRAYELEERVAELENSKSERIEREAPSYQGRKWDTWVKLYGDTAQSKDAYKDFMAEFAPPDEKYIQDLAVKAYEEHQVREERRVAVNERTIDDELEELSDDVGRELTEDEQVAVLEIMDENSLTDDNGRILRLYPAGKAWNIYESENTNRRSPAKAARDRVAELNNSNSSGEPSGTEKAKNNKDFDPRWEALDASLARRR